MKKNNVTIHDIARILNIDSSTVSRALNNSSRVSKKTKNLIFKKAEELGYQKNKLASNLRKNTTNTIGVVVPRISRHFFATAIAGIEESAYASGYNVIICQSHELLQREIEIIESFVNNRVAGVLISVSMETTEASHLNILEENGQPVVFFDRHCDMTNGGSVLINDYKAAYEATEHLILNGCKHIAHFSGPVVLDIYKNRLNGYKDALKKYDINFDESLIHYSKLMANDGIEGAKKILALNPKIDGLFSANDIAAVSAMQFLKSKNISIPNDIAVVGFSNEPIATVIEPALSTINQSGFKIGNKATELLLSKINNTFNSSNKTSIHLDATLIARASSIRKK